ncbi:MAG: hypothetical protein A3B37_03360 [Candidatus Sungbacteria bacterium RIFCSPLOWO2_01_FULL_59_16]|uniref:VanZ-like domain-containing protein n=1 Tax=Candidatus Sungbacteria bacterium RIFCSPLOWO2_01_FULL_59_16 TaxID=1802280 RepID=A0A1G2LC78_9BACT|nr:MAG: hypothetical protein A3B37_03360 [Candidatus Sungbacteria bacterium RIFCSPLOWO2_01_FULL_59_16]
MSAPKQYVLLALALGLFAFVVFIEFFATREHLRFIGAVQLDKAAHLTGGLFLAMLAEWRLPRLALGRFLVAFAAVALGWEVLEFFFDPETRFFYAAFPNLWVLDAAGDIAAALLGACGYRAFFRSRNANAGRA